MYNKGMLKELAKKWGWLAGLLATGMGQSAFAQNAALTLPNPLSANSFTVVVTQISTFLLEIAVPLTAIMALVGGFQMITAAGNPEKFASGRKTLTYAVIGFAVVLIAGGVAAIIKNFLTGS